MKPVHRAFRRREDLRHGTGSTRLRGRQRPALQRVADLLSEFDLGQTRFRASRSRIGARPEDACPPPRPCGSRSVRVGRTRRGRRRRRAGRPRCKCRGGARSSGRPR